VLNSYDIAGAQILSSVYAEKGVNKVRVAISELT
jgi:hypothetical protein